MESQRKIQDEDRLAQLGYRQELNRDWSLVHNFGVSFAIIVSILATGSSLGSIFSWENGSKYLIKQASLFFPTFSFTMVICCVCLTVNGGPLLWSAARRTCNYSYFTMQLLITSYPSERYYRNNDVSAAR
jgi:hypothetical protein